jgi:hypothetical protein
MALDFKRSNNQGGPVAKYFPRAARNVLAKGGGESPTVSYNDLDWNQTVQSRLATSQ